MDLRARQRLPFSGFTKAEVQKMEQLLIESREECLEEDYCKKLSRLFNRSSGRAGKPAVKWTEVQSWFQRNKKNCLSKETSSDSTNKAHVVPEAVTQNNATENPETQQGAKGDDHSKLEFEARSSKDGAWYDVDAFLGHKFLSSGDIEMCVRFIGFGAEEDEWVNVKNAIRERSILLEHSECKKVKAGDPVLCFQERQDQARYYDAHVVEVQRRLHDIRGCRCLFLIRYDHDNEEEKVRLRRICCQPNILAQLTNTST